MYTLCAYTTNSLIWKIYKETDDRFVIKIKRTLWFISENMVFMCCYLMITVYNLKGTLYKVWGL